MTLTIELSPDEQQRLLERAAGLGEDVTAYLRRLIREDLGQTSAVKNQTFAEILAPIHQDFRETGISEEELDMLLEEAVSETRAEKRRGNLNSCDGFPVSRFLSPSHFFAR